MVDDALAGGAPVRMGVLPWLRRSLQAEQERWAVWAPAPIGAGIGFYFALMAEPPAWLGPVTLLAALALALRLRGARRWAAGALALAALGFTAAQIHTGQVAAPMLDRGWGPGQVTGRVIARDAQPRAVRVVLDRVVMEDVAPEDTPARIRIRLPMQAAEIPIGSTLSALAALNPPSEPVAPGAFDFRRQSFFNGIGAIGFSYGRGEVEAVEDSAFALWLEGLRQDVTERVRAALESEEDGGDRAGIAAALLTGERGLIRDDAYQAVRDSGLAHLLAISGLHIGLVAGLLFIAVRYGLASVERVALRWPIKKIAAIAALIGALLYMGLVGATAPTQRAILMTGIGLFAIAIDRNPFSMRLISAAAAIVMLASPIALLGPSFQMSFAAVIALIATYETLAPRIAAWRRGAGRGRRFLLYAGGVALTSAVSSLATAPFSIFHFQNAAIWGVVSNMVAVPLTAFWIMPWGVLAYILMPFGLEGLALRPMGWGIDGMLRIAWIVAGWPGATLPIPAMPITALAAISLGGLWLTLWRTRWRLLGLGGVALGVALTAAAPRPTILIAADGGLLAVETDEGGFALSTLRRERFTRDIWMRRMGRLEAVAWPESGVDPLTKIGCDSAGCVTSLRGLSVSFIFNPAIAREECAGAQIVIATEALRQPCAAPVTIDWFDLWREGAHALTIENGGAVRVETVRETLGDRPWTRARRGQGDQ